MGRGFESLPGRQKFFEKKIGEVGEWFIPEVLKTSAPVMGPSVRIRPPPLNIQISKKIVIFIKVLLCVCLF